ncbi:MAG: DNA-directed RNA polymerase subunit omega [Candidatus Omnitrophica bacterium]|nr:DNA-directed RNA polymerase subunit omega [Candidatus Omnitrophota bacterium]MDD5236362.1 DNA-directed RNA polymerase subunit omega [Candidatus Omnitrophota bacterium]MDD5610703.1 DNA-directed RNA polymerase subunit omega [Candidatus Omnitrophota bacterium]
MDYVPLETLIDKTSHSLYKLVILASRRALEIAEGQPSLIGPCPNTKPSVVALREIAAGKVSYKITK